MREIKFRGKRVDNREWVYGGISININIVYIIEKIFIHDVITAEVIPETVGQFTGLFDKNGKEIYEGDILRLPPKDEYEKHTYNSFQVFYHDNDCTLTDCGLVIGRLKPHGNSAGGYSGYKLIPKHTSILEIIGNIHENSELLK